MRLPCGQRFRLDRARRTPWWLPALLGVVTACAGGRAVPAQPEARPDTSAVAGASERAPSPSGQTVAAARRGHHADSTEQAGTAGTTGGQDREVERTARGRTGEEGGRPAGAAADADAAGAAGAADAGAEATAPLPVPILPGALLPRTRIVAFYGNPASRTMGILGEVPPDEMLARLDKEVAAWREADPSTPVRPALQLITVMATGDPGRDSLFRLRMPDHRIEQVAEWAARRNALLFLDIQPGRSTVEDEIGPLESWLARPDVHLALDPEWAMPVDGVPGRQIGSLTAADVNYAIDFLADIVERYHLPPKVLVVHRFTTSMLLRADQIRRDPRVQVVINMDGWGTPPQKRAAYRDIVAPDADQFTGFKLFFHNDVREGSVLLTPSELLELHPAPLYIQYQ